MRKILLSGLVVLGTAMTSCYNDDDIQGRLSELEENQKQLEQDLARLEADYKNALDSTLTELKQDVADLGAADEEIQGILDGVDSTITEMEEIVASGNVFYGNLLTDADYQAFANDNYKVVSGKVKVTTADHYAAIQELFSIGGSLEITGLDNEMISLENLSVVSGELSIHENDGMTSLSLSALTLADGVSIKDNESAVSISMPALAVVNNSFVVTGNYLVTGNVGAGGTSDPYSITEFNVNNLVSIGQDYILMETIVPTIQNVNLSSVGGDYILQDHQKAGQIADLKLAYVGGDFVISENDELASIIYPALKEVGGDFLFDSNSRLVEDMSTVNFNQFFDSVETIQGNLTIHSPYGMYGFDAFNNLEKIYGDKIRIAGCVDILDGFSKFRSSNTDISIDLTGNGDSDPASYVDIQGFNELRRVKNLVIGRDSYIKDISGFQNLRLIVGYIHIGSITTAYVGNVADGTEGFPATIESISGLGSLEAIETSGRPNVTDGYLHLEVQDGPNVGVGTSYDVNDFAALIAIKSTNGEAPLCAFEALYNRYVSDTTDSSISSDVDLKFYNDEAEYDYSFTGCL